MLSSVSGNVNCKSPVRNSGILLAAKENIINGAVDTIPANQISELEAGS